MAPASARAVTFSLVGGRAGGVLEERGSACPPEARGHWACPQRLWPQGRLPAMLQGRAVGLTAWTRARPRRPDHRGDTPGPGAVCLLMARMAAGHHRTQERAPSRAPSAPLEATRASLPSPWHCQPRMGGGCRGKPSWGNGGWGPGGWSQRGLKGRVWGQVLVRRPSSPDRSGLSPGPCRRGPGGGHSALGQLAGAGGWGCRG